MTTRHDPPSPRPIHALTVLAPALALALALCGTARAQSVVLYGVMDVAAASVQGASGGVNRNDVKLRQLVNGGMSTSHFGLRGTEDLGSGLVASFDLSSFVRADTGATGRSDAIGAPVNVAADTFWSRAAWVGLSSASLGRVRLGNVTTLLFTNSISSNPYGDSTVLSPLNLVTFIGSPLSGGTGWTNSVVYDTPRIAGFTVAVARSASEGNGGRNSGARVAWSQGDAAASLAWQNVKKNPTTFADGTSANNTEAWQLAVSYDFKVVKLFGHLGRIENNGTEAVPLGVAYRVRHVGASVPLGSGRFVAAIATRKTGDTPALVPATAAGGNVRREVISVGYDHDLSKRTDVYAVWMRDSTDTRTLPAPGTVLKANGNTLAVGLRHRF